MLPSSGPARSSSLEQIAFVFPGLPVLYQQFDRRLKVIFLLALTAIALREREITELFLSLLLPCSVFVCECACCFRCLSISLVTLLCESEKPQQQR